MTDAIELFKKQFHRDENLIHLNNAGQAPIARIARETMELWARRLYEEGAHAVRDMIKATHESKVSLAKFLNCDAGEIAFFPTTAGALSQVAFGIDLKANDEVIVWDQEYPSNFYPWRDAAKLRGAKFVVAESGPNLETPVEKLISYVTPKTKVIAVSMVQYRSGAITDLKALTDFAKSKGIFVSVDIIQGAGVLPFDFKASGVDAVSSGSHKWMTSGHGAGYLILKQDHFDRVNPIQSGAVTYGGPDDANSLTATPRKDIHRYEPGGKAFVECITLGRTAELFMQTGIDRIAQEAEWLAKRLMHGLRERGYVINSPHANEFRGAIVNFSVGTHSKFKNQEAIEQCFTENNISFGKRPPGLRLSPHAFNQIEDIDRVLSLL